MDFRVGFGNDIHKLVDAGSLIIGGVKIFFDKGTQAHSDGDVLAHAVCDALLGALALKDIGSHFPDTDNQYKDICSLHLLEKVMVLVNTQGFRVNNIDCTVVLEKPKLASYIDEICQNLASILAIDVNKVSVKAKTNEKLGDIGNGNAIAAFCVVSLLHNDC